MDGYTCEPRRKNACLTTLPLDVQMNLMGFLEPFDILTLRTTCRALCYATRQLIVWINALRKICIENSVFLPTFPLEKMKIQELERAATAPYRWLSLASRDRRTVHHHDRTLHPCTRKMIPHEHSQAAQEYSQVYLVPGGRYLVLCSPYCLEIWDLDPRPGLEASRLSQPLAQRHCKFYDEMVFVHPTPDGQGLRILVQSYLSDVELDHGVYLIFEIYPNSPAAQLARIAYLEETSLGDIALSTPSGDTLVLFDGSVLKVWDYKSDAWASWAITRPTSRAETGATEREYVKIITTPSCIILIHGDGASIWKIPPLISSATKKPFSHVDPLPVPALFECPYPPNVIPFLPKVSVLACPGPCDWYAGNSSHPYTYDVGIADSHSSPISSYYLRFEVTIRDDLSAARVILRNAFSCSSFKCYPEMYRFCCGSLSTLGFDDELETAGILAESVASESSVVPFELGTFSTMQSSDNAHTTLELPQDSLVAFCPISGRVAFVDHDKSCIVVEDFVPNAISYASPPSCP